jgi:hypothetical protein
MPGPQPPTEEGRTVHVLASDQYQWFWWIAPILTVVTLLTIGLLSGEYLRRVIIPRVKGRRVE